MAAESLDIIVRMKDLASKQAKALGGTLSSVAKGSASAFAGLYKTLFNIPNALAAVTAGVAAQKLVQGIELATNLEAIENGFKNLTREAGGAKAVLEALQRGTRGTVSDFNLMQIANKAMLLGVGKSAEEFEKLANISRRMGRAVGRDATEAFADLTMGMGRESRLILDNLGIIVDAEEAYKKFARQLGTTVEKLSDVQKRTAFTNAVFEATSVAAKRLGFDAWTLADSWGRFVTTLRNLRDDVLRSLIPMLQDIADGMATGIKNNKAVIYDFIATLLDNFGRMSDTVGTISDKIGGLVKNAANTWVALKVVFPSFFAKAVDKQQEEAEAAARASSDFAKELFFALNKAQAPIDERVKALNWWKTTVENLGRVTRQSSGDLGDQAKKIMTVGEAARLAAKALRDAFTTTSTRRVGGGASLLPDMEQFERFFKKYERYVQYKEVASKGGLPALFDQGAESRSLAQYRQMMADDESNMYKSAMAQTETPEYRRLMEEAREKRREDMIEEGKLRNEALEKTNETNRALREQYQLGSGVASAFKKMADEAQSFGAIGARVVSDMAEGIADSMVDPLWDFISMTKDAGEAFTEMGKAILEMLGKIILQETLTMGVKAAFSGIGGLFSSSATDTANSINLAGWAGDGGVFPGHLQRVKGHFARGDVARERGLYELRERGQDEAVIPLVGNRYVPVKMMSTDPQGGSSKQIVNNFSFTFQGDSKQFARQLRENAEAVASIVAEKQNSSMRFREAMAA